MRNLLRNLFFPIVLLWTTACDSSTSNQHQDSSSYQNYLNDCISKSSNQLKKIEDSLHNFELKIPINWSVKKVLANDFNGILAADTTRLFKYDSVIMLSVNQYKISADFRKFIEEEENKMSKDSLSFIYSSSYNDNEFHIGMNEYSRTGTELTHFHVYRFVRPNTVLMITLSINRTKKPKNALCRYWYIIHSVQPILYQTGIG